MKIFGGEDPAALGVIGEDVLPEDDQVLSRGFLLGVGKARRVAESRVQHPDRAGLLRHAPREFLLGTGKSLGDGHGHVVRRLRDDGANGVSDGNRIARREAELRRRLVGRVL